MVVLYRSYRPEKWSDVMGQDHVVKALKESVSADRISHAYLFSGSRGTGKTSVARILAKELKTASDDVFEIDAASNRGIDDVRELREHVNNLPFRSKYKVYIIDEVHMLSKDAWNALLKTIEEPPEHVVFILATTEIEKVPETIVSRCQCFVFRKPGREILRKQVASVAKKEGFDLDAGASDLIALLGDGSFRDALGILEKVISISADKKLSREEVEDITGAPKAMLVNTFIEAYITKNADTALSRMSQAISSGISVITYSTLILEKIRMIFLLQNSPSSSDEIRGKVSPDDWIFIEEQAKKKLLTPSMLVVLLEAVDGVNRSSVPELPLEIAVVKNCGIV